MFKFYSNTFKFGPWKDFKVEKKIPSPKGKFRKFEFPAKRRVFEQKFLAQIISIRYRIDGVSLVKKFQNSSDQGLNSLALPSVKNFFKILLKVPLEHFKC